jgi:hypothetical protein
MPNTVSALRTTLPLGVAAGCAVAMMVPIADAADKVNQTELERLRAQGPVALAGMFERYDKLPAGPQKNQLAYEIDRVAAQRYATVSRLYWYTDLDAAERAAKTSNRPILALRMLGRLDEEFSCANSRLFRTVLYANTEVSKLLRDHFILYWSTERPVPKVTIDMGDGRTITRTTTGNSAHYVLDANGNVLDVLPGLYTPAVFKQELTKSLELAARVRGLDANRRKVAIQSFHRTALQQRAEQWAKIAGGTFERGDRSFVTRLEKAQRATMSKMIMEAPDLTSFGMKPGTISRDEVDAWAAIGVKLWNLDGGRGNLPRRIGFDEHARPRPQAFGTFDQRSMTLIAWLHDHGQKPSGEAQIARMIARLEYSVIADTALDELQLRQQIRSHLIGSREIPSFDKLNEWIYAEVFHTPKSDPWLGLVPRTDFTGLPGDGVATR